MGGTTSDTILYELDHDHDGILDRNELRRLVACVDPRNKEIGPLFKDVRTLLKLGGGSQDQTLSVERLKQAFKGLNETQTRQLLHFVRRYKQRRLSNGNLLPEIWLFGRNTEHRKDRYRILGRVAEVGGFATVYKACLKEDGETKCQMHKREINAIKVLSKSKMYASGLLGSAAEEINIMKKTSHKNVITLLDYYEDEDNIYIVMPFMEGGELCERMLEYRGHEGKTASITAQMLQAISHLHGLGIAHCDIKPENFLFRKPERRLERTYTQALTRREFQRMYPDTWEKEWALAERDPDPCWRRASREIVLIDFGISRHLRGFMEVEKERLRKEKLEKNCHEDMTCVERKPSEAMATEARGTACYMAPEVLSGNLSMHCDLWSLGVLIFELLYGYPPFDCDEEDLRDGDQTENEIIFGKIKKGFNPVLKEGRGPWFNKEISISKEARNLLASLLESDPVKRASAAEALLSPWFKSTKEAMACRRKIVERGIKEVRDMSTFRKFMISLAASGHHVALSPLHKITSIPQPHPRHNFHAHHRHRGGGGGVGTIAEDIDGIDSDDPFASKDRNTNDVADSENKSENLLRECGGDSSGSPLPKMKKSESMPTGSWEAKRRRDREEGLSVRDVLRVLEGDATESLDGKAPLNVSCSALALYGRSRSCGEELSVPVGELRMLLANCAIVAKEERLRSLFDSMDTDGDHKIDRSEFMTALKHHGINLTDKEMEEAFSAVDVDDNHQVDYVEFLNAFGVKTYKDVFRAPTEESSYPAIYSMQNSEGKHQRRSSACSPHSDSSRSPHRMPYIFAPKELKESISTLFKQEMCGRVNSSQSRNWAKVVATRDSAEGDVCQLCRTCLIA